MIYNNYCVYQHTCPNGKVYIGQTKNKPECRWKNGKGYKGCKVFYNSIKKYGWDNIDHFILASNLTKEEADDLEISLIKIWKDMGLSLNITDGGEGMTGWHPNEETRLKMSEAQKGRFVGKKGSMYGRHHTEEAKKKLSKANKGKQFSEEHRKKLSEAHRGKYPSEETRKKRSQALKGRKFTEEHKKKISESNKGKQRSDETKKKIYEAKKGKIVSEETKKKISEANKGRIVSENTRRKMSNSHPKNPVLQLTIDEKFITEFESMMEAERQTGIRQTHISDVCKCRRKTAGGYKWKYKEI